MRLNSEQRGTVEAFRRAFEARLAGDARFAAAERDDRDDESLLASRFRVADRLWLELAVRPFVPQVRVGIVTDDRWKNEDLEDKIEESGDTMSEFVELGFEEAGLEWREPPVEHFREQGRFFVFATAIELRELSELALPGLMDRVSRMFEGYYQAFRPAIEKAAAQT